jgi:hypothetical protein
MSVALALSFVMLGADVPAPVRFPGTSSSVAAPGGRYAAQWVPADGAGQPHRLVVKDLRSGDTRVSRDFSRWVVVAWSPTGEWLAVTDGVGSDGAAAWIYRLDGSDPVSVVEELARQHGEKALAFAVGAHHAYVQADKWLDNVTVSVRVWGYGGAKVFSRRLSLRLRP